MPTEAQPLGSIPDHEYRAEGYRPDLAYLPAAGVADQLPALAVAALPPLAHAGSRAAAASPRRAVDRPVRRRGLRGVDPLLDQTGPAADAAGSGRTQLPRDQR